MIDTGPTRPNACVHGTPRIDDCVHCELAEARTLADGRARDLGAMRKEMRERVREARAAAFEEAAEIADRLIGETTATTEHAGRISCVSLEIRARAKLPETHVVVSVYDLRDYIGYLQHDMEELVSWGKHGRAELMRADIDRLRALLPEAPADG